MNKHIPKNECPKCHKIVWDYNDEKDIFKCKFCKSPIQKRLHGIVGGVISKDEDSRYVLSFPEYLEKGVYPEWKDLQEKMDKLAKNEVENE